MNKNTDSVEGLSRNPDTTNGQAKLLPRYRSKAEIRAERLSWALWACGVYKRASDKEKQAMFDNNDECTCFTTWPDMSVKP